MRALADEKDSFEVPLTPLIDVVFLLLIFFLVATTFNHKEMDHKVNLAQAEGGAKPKYERRNLVINVRKNGFVVIHGRVVAEGQLPAMLEQWRSENPGMRVLLRGDGKVEYSRVMTVMGICRTSGIERVDLPVYSVSGKK